MEDNKPTIDRRDFLSLTAMSAMFGMGAAAVPAASAIAADAPATDFTRWLDGIPGKHRVLLDMREPNGGMALAWAWVYLFTGPPAYGVKESDLGVALVLRHNAIPVALNDAAWAKYKLGEFFQIKDPTTNAAAVRNPYYATMADPFLPDMALQKLVDRGVKVVACDMAIHFYSMLIAKQMGAKHEDVKADWMQSVLPGIAHAPSGLIACQGAQARGCSYIFAG